MLLRSKPIQKAGSPTTTQPSRAMADSSSVVREAMWMWGSK